MSRPSPVHAVPTQAEIEAGQREYQRKWESGEFLAESREAKRKLNAVVPHLLAGCRAVHRVMGLDAALRMEALEAA